MNESEVDSSDSLNLQLPDDLPFEYLLKHAEELYRQYPPDMIEKDVEEMIVREYVYQSQMH